MIIKIPDLRQSSFSEISKWIKYYGKIKEIDFNNLNEELSFYLNDNAIGILPKYIEGYISAGDSLINFLPHYSTLSSEIAQALNKEQIVFYDSIFYFLRKNKYFGKVKKTVDNNKIIDLINARKCNISIPDTIISTSKREIKKFFIKNKNDKIITKSLGGLLRFETEDEILWGKGTTIVDITELNNYKEILFPSIFQKYIEKEYEIRTFYFKGEFYSMAIFSQNDDKTKIDFRNYNIEKPNRMVPFKLPDDIEIKLKKFMEISELDTGSIDLIVSKEERRFVFLEVNPFGQFGWLSKNTNYYIERHIAKYFEDYEN